MLSLFNHLVRCVVKMLCAIGLGICCISGASPVLAIGNLMDVSVVDRDTGQALTVYPWRGQLYVAGTPGNHYAVSLRNLQNKRLLAVISVDGVNVVSGETASQNQTGYVLAPLGSTEIYGWRKSQQQIAAFVFSDEAASYAARTGRPQNVGVIGVALFRERQRQYLERNRESQQDSKQAAPGTNSTIAPQQTPRLGTAHGEREESYAAYTDFVRARSFPDEQISIRYDSFQNLLAQGVIPRYRQPQNNTPNPFPSGQFVPDPR
jgi:hypothetical protein